MIYFSFSVDGSLGMTKVGVSLAVLGSLMASQAFAAVSPVARLASVDGPVLVNQGAGFTPVTESTVLHPGDRLLSLRGAHAHLIYANGCAVSLKANAMLTVTDMARGASCKGAASQVADTDFTGDQAQAAAGAAAAGGGAGAGAGAAGLSTLAIAGGVAGAGAVGLGVAAATGALGKTTSP
jgi:hypothetical protein